MKESMGYAQHNPNAGEDQVFYSGNADGNTGPKSLDPAGVTMGLSMVEKCNTKDYDNTTVNQRPMSSSMKAGAFRIGY
jgi:hypothetical protein